MSHTQYGPDLSRFTDDSGDMIEFEFDTNNDIVVGCGDWPVRLDRGQQLALVRMILDRHNGPSMFARRSYDQRATVSS